MTGVTWPLSELRLAEIDDGTSHTYLVGEKYLNPDHYEDGTDPADDHSMFQGYDWDIHRFATLTIRPLHDQPGRDASLNFGSAHSAAMQMAYGDGSVRLISYAIDPATHRSLANRQDGRAVREPE